MELEPVQERSKWDKINFIIHIIIVIFITTLTGLHSITSIVSYHYLFTWHVILGSLACLLLAPISLLVINKVLLKKYTRKQKHKIHGIIIFLATILAVISVCLDFIRKEIYKKEYPEITHFHSPHAIIGLVSVILFVILNFSGLFAYNFSWFGGKIKPVVLGLWHNILGQIAYILGLVSIFVLFYTPWYIRVNTLCGTIVMGILIIFVMVWTLINPIIRAYEQCKSLL